MAQITDHLTVDFEVAAGDVVAGKYRIDRVIGAGGMGVVFAATHLALDERVALKFLLPEAAADAVTVARFLREGRAAAKIRSEHVARVFDVGKTEDGAAYLVMEHLEGQDLRALLRDHGKLPAASAVDFVLMACEALAEAHAAGIVHRDLKPSNLFLTQRADGSPCVKVLDFGISKIAAAGAFEADMTMTGTSSLLGSPRYMSPEQMTCSRDVDARSDVWALGVILHELMTGERPYAGANIPELCMNIAGSSPTPLRGHLPDAPEGLERAITKCLARDRDLRHADVAELAMSIVPWASESGQRSAPRIVRVRDAARFRPPAPRDPPDPRDAALDPEAQTRPPDAAPETHASHDDARSPPNADVTISATTFATPPPPARRKLAGVLGVVAAIAAAGALGFAAARTSRDPAGEASREAAQPASSLPLARGMETPLPSQVVTPQPDPDPPPVAATASPSAAPNRAPRATTRTAAPETRARPALRKDAPTTGNPASKKPEPFDSRQWE